MTTVSLEKPTAPDRGLRTIDVVMRVVGGAISVVLAVLLAVYATFLVPLRLFGFRVPISIVLAVVGSLALTWFAMAVTGRRLFPVIPGVVWLIVVYYLAGGTSERDVVLQDGNWVASWFLLVGSLTWGLIVAFLVLSRVSRVEPGSTQ